MRQLLRSGRRWRTHLAGLVVLAVVLPAVAQLETIPEDILLQGRGLHAFGADGEAVTVVLGNFSLQLGRRSISGRDAVLWIRPADESGARAVTVYVEGNATVVEPDGTSVTDDRMLVHFRHAGGMSTLGPVTRRDLEGFPLYRRALLAREQFRPAARPRDPRQAPALIIAQPDDETAPRPRPDAPRPGPDTPAPPFEPEPTVSLPPYRVPPAEPVAPVTFRAGQMASRPAEDPPGERLTIASGGVYLAQQTDQGLLEIRSQSAVVFSSPRLAEDASPAAADAPAGIIGVYLEGDVVIAMGNRTLRARRAYYDFLTDRAILLDVVFRTIQEQRLIPVYVRARQVRMLSRREMWFRDAKVSTSEFHTPTYHIGARTAYVMDTTPRDPQTGETIGEQRILADLQHTTANVRGVPFLYLPWIRTELQEDTTAVRKVSVGGLGTDDRDGFLVQWHLFRLLGMQRPSGYDGTVELESWLHRGGRAEGRLRYSRPEYHGDLRATGVWDRQGEDEFGELRRGIDAPEHRGRVAWRHKQWLAEHWMVQTEVNYLSDRNYLEQFHPNEFYAGKEPETLLYALRQQENWAISGLVRYRLNDFQTQAESLPEIAGFWLGQPLAGPLVYFSESRIGVKRWRVDERMPDADELDSGAFVRGDTRHEVNAPLRVGPVNFLPFAAGRLTWWSDTPDGHSEFRPMGVAGVHGTTHLWRVYDGAQNRLLDLHRLRHIVTPHVAAWYVDPGGVFPGELYPMDPDIERHIRRAGGVSVGLHQRLQTQRGQPGARYTADWMRLNVEASWFHNRTDWAGRDGRFSVHRPEYSLARNHISGEYFWHISDSTTFLADANYDLDDDQLTVWNAGLAVVRSPRLKYYLGMRRIRDQETKVGTFGFDYQINPKYTLSFFEQYDFDFRGGRNVATRISLVRRFPRWHIGTTFNFTRRVIGDDEWSVMLTIWPHGVPELRVGTDRHTILGGSNAN